MKVLLAAKMVTWDDVFILQVIFLVLIGMVFAIYGSYINRMSKEVIGLGIRFRDEDKEIRKAFGKIHNKINNNHDDLSENVSNLKDQINLFNSELTSVKSELKWLESSQEVDSNRLKRFVEDNTRKVIKPLKPTWTKLFIEQNDKSKIQFLLHDDLFENDKEINDALNRKDNTAIMVNFEGNETVKLSKNNGDYWSYLTFTTDHPVKITALEIMTSYTSSKEEIMYKEVEVVNVGY